MEKPTMAVNTEAESITALFLNASPGMDSDHGIMVSNTQIKTTHPLVNNPSERTPEELQPIADSWPPPDCRIPLCPGFADSIGLSL